MPLCQPSARFAVIGQPVDHSLSPYIHKNFASQWSVDLDYDRLELSPEVLTQGLTRFAAEGGVGANVTLPHKRAVMDLCGELAPRARRAQSVNTLSVIDGVWHGDNTDGVALVNDLCLRRNIDLRGRHTLLLGAGGLGSPAALYLAAAGVGTIGIVDMDVVDESNLQRQILHNIDRIGDRKVDSAKKTLTMLNPDVNVVTYDTRLDASNIMDILDGYDVVVDGADNFPSRYLLNDASVKLGIPVVHGSIFRFEGMVSVFDPKGGPTYRDMVPEPPPAELAPSCAEAGVLGVLPGIVGSIQALETIKVLLGLGDSLSGRILAIDTTEMSFRTFRLRPDPNNQVTYANRDRIEVRDLEGACAPWLSH